VLSVELPIAIN